MTKNQIKIGDLAPEIDLPLQSGKNFKLSDHRGSKVVIYFYPKDNTPGCTMQAKDFAANIDKFKKKSCVVVGISKDGLKSHSNFYDKCELNFDLASDEKSNVSEMYGVWIEKSMYGKKYMGIERSTFLVDEKGKIEKVWRGVKVEGHVKEVLEYI